MRPPKRRRSGRADGQQVPPGGGIGLEQGSLDDLDLISRLPDDVLGTIVSLLRTKEGARTQVLSRRWFPLWCSPMAPLNLGADDTLSGDDTRVAVVSKILSDHPGPARHFSLYIISLPGFPAKVARWFRSVTLNGLEELQVTSLQVKRYPLPPQALTRFAPTLRVLRLYRCRFRNPPNFPHLKQLSLYDVGILEDSLQCLISCCAILESLQLRSMRFVHLCISSPTLRSIKLNALRRKGGELVIQDAPCLERLLPNFPNNGPTTIRVIDAPKLEMLGYLSEGISTFQLGTAVFQKMIAVNLTTKMHTVKILALNSTGAKLDAAIDFLKCFPCLEKLYVVLSRGKGMNNSLKYNPLDRIECLEFYLQKVVLKNYYGDKRAFIDFAKFFVLNAKVLKQMEIGVVNRVSEEWMCDQRRKLQVENRASRDVKFELRSHTYACPSNYEYTLDFSLADPFESKHALSEDSFSLCLKQEKCDCSVCLSYVISPL